jgi:U6 snRNA-associated Sm-like protein LSm7
MNKSATEDRGSSYGGSKEAIMKVTTFLDKEIEIRFQGGRLLQGRLKGLDHHLNLVLDGTTETIRGDQPAKGLRIRSRSC